MALERGSLVEQLIEPRRRRRQRWHGWRRIGAALGIVAVVVIAVVAAIVVTHRQQGKTPRWSLPTAVAMGKRARTVVYTLDVAYGNVPPSTIEATLDRDRNLVGFRLTSAGLLGSDAPISGSLDLAADRVTLPRSLFQDLGAVPAGVSWVSFGIDRWSTLDVGALLDRVTRDPVDVVRAFGGLSGSVDLGREEVDGVQLEHIQVPGTMAALFQQLPDIGALVRADSVPKDAVYDVWVSEANELRRVQLGFVDGSTPVTYDLRISSIGQPVVIDVPAPGTVVDVATLTH